MSSLKRSSLAVVVLALLTLGALPAAGVNVAQPVVVSDDPVNFTPHVVDGAVYDIVQIGNRVYAGGTFTTIRQTADGANVARSFLFAFNATTGAIDTTFAPVLDGDVLTLAVAPDGNLFAGGNFNTVNGVRVRKLVKLDATSGQRISTFTATADARVRELIVRGSTLYVGGVFTTLAGAAREKLGAVDATTGAIDPRLNLPITVPRISGTTPSVYAMDVTPDGSRLLVIGNFTRIGGIERWQAGMIDLTTAPATVANWETDGFRPACNTTFDTYMRDVEFSPDGSYFVIVTTGSYAGGAGTGVLCDASSRWETAAAGENLTPTWVNYTGGDTLYSVAITGTAVYVGGHPRWQNNPFQNGEAGPGAVPREGIAALDPINGLPFRWNPGRTRGVGVFALYSTPTGLWVGSDTDRLGGETHRKIGMFPVAGGTTVPPNVAYTLPGELFNARQVLVGTVTALDHRSFDGSQMGARSSLSTPGLDWNTTRGLVLINEVLYHGTSGGQLIARSFDGQTLGAAQPVDLHGLTNFPLSNVTGMFFDPVRERLYYTVNGNRSLFWRWFTPESRVVGAQVFQAGGSVNWSTTRGMTMVNGTIYFARSDGNLYAIPFNAGSPSGTPTIVSPGTAGYNWASRGMFVDNGGGGGGGGGGDAIFADDFSGGFANWTTTSGLQVDGARGATAAPSARAEVAGSVAFARRGLGSTFDHVCASVSVNPETFGSSPDLIRLRTAANGPIARVLSTSAGVLRLRSDVSGVALTTSGSLTFGAWNTIEVCGTVSTGSWDLYVNGAQVVDGWTANTGSTPIGMVQIGDTAQKTWTANFDDVVVDVAAG